MKNIKDIEADEELEAMLDIRSHNVSPNVANMSIKTDLSGSRETLSGSDDSTEGGSRQEPFSPENSLELSDSELPEDICENTEGLDAWKKYETFLKEEKRDLAEKFYQHALSIWDSSARKNNKNAIINLSFVMIDRISMVLWAMSKVFSEEGVANKEENLMNLSLEKRGFENNAGKVKVFLDALISGNGKWTLYTHLKKHEYALLKQKLYEILKYAQTEDVKQHFHLHKILYETLKKYEHVPRVLVWLFLMPTEEPDESLASRNKQLKFLLKSINYFEKFISLDKTKFEDAVFYGKIFDEKINTVLQRCYFPFLEEKNLEWKEMADIKKTMDLYADFIHSKRNFLSNQIEVINKKREEEIYKLPKKASPQIQNVKKCLIWENAMKPKQPEPESKKDEVSVSSLRLSNSDQ